MGAGTMSRWTHGDGDRLTNVGLVLALIVCIGSWGWYYAQSSLRGAVDTDIYPVGSDFSAYQEFSPLRGHDALVLVVSSTCPVCTESMPFYRHIIDRRTQAHSDLVIAAVSRESVRSLSRYLAAHGVNTDVHIEAGYPTSFQIRMTPTLILLDEMQRVRRVWYGRLNDTEQPTVLAAALEGEYSGALP